MSHRLLVLLCAAMVTVAACGGDSDGGAADDTTSAPAETSAPANSGDGAQDGDTVAVDYTGTLDNGEEFDSSIGRQPLEFVLGTGQVISGFDDAVRGLSVGDTVTVRIPPEEAYGMPDPSAFVDFPIDEVPEDLRSVGAPVQFGNGARGVVTEVTESTVTIDLNHNLAGEALTFEITVVSISAG